MSEDFKVIGYMPAWKTNKLIKIRYDVLTHVIYSFAFPDEEGNLCIPNVEKANEIIAMAHNANVKVILSFGGWSDFGESRKDILINSISDDAKMNQLIKDLIQSAYDLSFDGIDLNWGNFAEDLSQKDLVEKFTKKLSEEIHNKEMTFSLSCFGNYDESNDVLSFEIVSSSQELVECYDWINIISYEQREGVRATNTNLKMEGGFVDSIKVPNEKTVMGIPFFINVSAMAYSEDIKENRNQSELSTEIVTCGREIYCLADDEFLSKVQWSKRNVVGLNVWEVTQDFNDINKSLLTKIKENI